MSFGMRNEKGVAFRSPRRSSSPDGTAVLPEHLLEVLYIFPSADGTAILTKEELDWLQSGGVFPRAPPPQKGRSSFLGDKSSAESVELRGSSGSQLSQRSTAERLLPPPPVQIGRGVGSIAARSIPATGSDCAQWTRDAVAYGGSEGSKPCCASQRRGTLWLLG